MGKSLDERVHFFKRRYPGSNISIYKIKTVKTVKIVNIGPRLSASLTEVRKVVLAGVGMAVVGLAVGVGVVTC